MPFVGLDIGNNTCKLAERSGQGFHLVSARMPENLVHEGKVASPESLTRFLNQVHKEEGIKGKDVAVVLNATQVFFRHVTFPPMDTDELLLNLPYEFRDFISDDPEGYVYDYAVDEIVKDEEGKTTRLELFAAAAPKELINNYETMLKKSGFRLKMATPAPMAYAKLLQGHAIEVPEHADRDVMLVDIGSEDVSIMMFRGLKYDSARTIDFGCSEFDLIIADMKGIDPYTAGAYKFSNFENVLDDERCVAMCDRFAMEVAKVVNFYNFNNPDREIEQLYFLGGGARIKHLTDAITEAISVPAATIEELLPIGARGQMESPVCALAVAGILSGEGMK